MKCFVCHNTLELSSVSPNLFHCPCKKMLACPQGYFEFYQLFNNLPYHVKGSSAYQTTTINQLQNKYVDLGQFSVNELSHFPEITIFSFEHKLIVSSIDDLQFLLPRLLKLIAFS